MDTSYRKLGSYKGLNGKIGVIGGCFEYTGAPYYAAVSALRSGSDLAHIFCTKSAGGPIKSYSPEIIVHPSLASSMEDTISDFSQYSDLILENTSNWFSAIHSLIVGPGLGRDPFLTQHLIPKLLTQAITQKTSLIIDADGINILSSQPGLLGSYSDAVLTPNIVEFRRLWKAYMGNEAPEISVERRDEVWSDSEDQGVNTVKELALRIGVVIVLKGHVDIITDGSTAVCVGIAGSEKRCGGQGDILAGVIGTTLWNSKRNQTDRLMALATACVIVRKSANIAFKKKQRSLTAPDIIKCLPTALIHITGEYSL